MSSHEPHLTDAMRRALVECHAKGEMTAWAYGSSTVGALKRCGFIAPKTKGLGTHYVITDSGRAAIGVTSSPHVCTCFHAPEQHGADGCGVIGLTTGSCPCRYDGRKPSEAS